MSKAKAQRKHAKKRFAERFGMTFDLGTERTFIKKIQSGDAEFVEKQSNRVSLFDVNHDGEVFRVVYDKERHCIVTVLPEEVFDESAGT